MASAAPQSVADIESFVNLLRAACADPKMNEQLERLLSFSDQKRQNMIHTWVSDMIIAQAPKDFIAAIACLRDDKIAEKAYEVIFKCKRGDAL